MRNFDVDLSAAPKSLLPGEPALSLSKGDLEVGFLSEPRWLIERPTPDPSAGGEFVLLFEHVLYKNFRNFLKLTLMRNFDVNLSVQRPKSPPGRACPELVEGRFRVGFLIRTQIVYRKTHP